MNKYTKRYKNFDEFCKEIKTMDELLKWYKANNIQWPKIPKSGDANDNPMAWPDDIVKTKTGCCWDHAIFMHYFCERNNIPHGNLYIQIFEEIENEYWCVGHAIGLYQTDNGWNFFNIHGQEIYSHELDEVDWLTKPNDKVEWQKCSLPSDNICTENATILQRFNRYPLKIK